MKNKYYIKSTTQIQQDLNQEYESQKDQWLLDMYEEISKEIAIAIKQGYSGVEVCILMGNKSEIELKQIIESRGYSFKRDTSFFGRDTNYVTIKWKSDSAKGVLRNDKGGF